MYSLSTTVYGPKNPEEEQVKGMSRNLFYSFLNKKMKLLHDIAYYIPKQHSPLQQCSPAAKFKFLTFPSYIFDYMKSQFSRSFKSHIACHYR